MDILVGEKPSMAGVLGWVGRAGCDGRVRWQGAMAGCDGRVRWQGAMAEMSDKTGNE
jgi:hypothetical protein